jgi:hypothetical protein
VAGDYICPLKSKLFTNEIMSHLLSFTPKSPEGDFQHLQAFMMLTTEEGVWSEIIPKKNFELSTY